MARFFPVRSQCQFDIAASGVLPSGWEAAGGRLPLVEQRPGRTQGALYPDFDVLYPPRGVLILNVKGWNTRDDPEQRITALKRKK